jgi:hypothetical protein
VSLKCSELVRNSDLPRTTKYVLLAFADHGREDREAGGDAEHVEFYAFPSFERVAWCTGLLYRTVKRRVKELRDAQLLISAGYADDRSDVQPRGRVPKYRNGVERLPPRPCWRSGTGGQRGPLFARQGAIQVPTGGHLRPRIRINGF